jgi:F5/8 type C domain
MANVALLTAGAVATASNYYSNYYPSNAIDNNPSTFWRTTSQGNGHWLKVALLDVYNIGEVVLRWHSNAAWRPYSYYLEYSDDGAAWEIEGSYACLGEIDTITLPAARNKQYWRVRAINCPANTAFICCSFEIWESSEPPFPNPECDYDEVLRDTWDQTGGLHKGPVLEAYAIPYLVGTGSLYNYLAAILCRLDTLHAKVDDLALSGGEHDPSNQAIYDAVLNVDADLQSGISAIAANDNANTALIREDVADCQTGLTTLINAESDEIQANDDNHLIFLQGDIAFAINSINDHTDSKAGEVMVNDDGNADVIRGAPPTDLRSLLDTMTSSFAQQTLDLAGPLVTMMLWQRA